MAKSAKASASSPVEIITDPKKIKGQDPLITVRSGQTSGKTFLVKINQPAGRALLIAVHL
jgi:hypothetical protein